MYTKIRFFRKHFFNLCFKIFLASCRSNRTRIKNFFIFNKTTYYFFIFRKCILNKTIFLRKNQNPSVISQDVKNPHFCCQTNHLLPYFTKKNSLPFFKSRRKISTKSDTTGMTSSPNKTLPVCCNGVLQVDSCNIVVSISANNCENIIQLASTGTLLKTDVSNAHTTSVRI